MSTRVLVADPPWSFSDALPGATRGASKQYPCMTVEDICTFSLPPLANNCVLFLWRVASMQREAIDVVSAWGFTVKSELVWAKQTKNGKPHFGMGRYVRASHEACLIATRGKNPPKVRNQRSVFYAPVGRHSAKPDEFYDIVNRMYDGPFVELFARTRRDGWEQFGNQLEAA